MRVKYLSVIYPAMRDEWVDGQQGRVLDRLKKDPHLTGWFVLYLVSKSELDLVQPILDALDKALDAEGDLNEKR